MGEEGELQGEIPGDPPLGPGDWGRRPKGLPYPLGEAVDLPAGGPSGVQRILQPAEVVEDDPEQLFEHGGALSTGLRRAPDRLREGDAKVDPRSVAASVRTGARRPAAAASTLAASTLAARRTAASVGGRLRPFLAPTREAAQSRGRPGVKPRLRAESPASFCRLRTGAQPGPRLTGVSAAGATHCPRPRVPAVRPEPAPRRCGTRILRRESRARRAGNPRNDAARHGAGDGARAARYALDQAALAAGSSSRPRRRLEQRRFRTLESAGAVVLQGEPGQWRSPLHLAARAVLRGHAGRAARRLAGGERPGQEMPVVDLDPVFSEDRHREVELGDVVDVDPQARLPIVAESGEPGAQPVVLPEQLPAGQDRPRIELAHESSMQLQDGENFGV